MSSYVHPIVKEQGFKVRWWDFKLWIHYVWELLLPEPQCPQM